MHTTLAGLSADPGSFRFRENTINLRFPMILFLQTPVAARYASLISEVPHPRVVADLNCSVIQSITTRRRGDNCRAWE